MENKKEVLELPIQLELIIKLIRDLVKLAKKGKKPFPFVVRMF